MAPRANWKGFLRLSLVTRPVALYPADRGQEADKRSGREEACCGAGRRKSA